MRKILVAILMFSSVIFAPPALTQVVINFQSQPTEQQLIPVIESAAKDKNYSTVLRVSNNAIKLFPDLATAYYYRAIAQARTQGFALSNLGQPEAAKSDFEQAKKLYVNQLKSDKISAQEKSEAQNKLGKS